MTKQELMDMYSREYDINVTDVSTCAKKDDSGDMMTLIQHRCGHCDKNHYVLLTKVTITSTFNPAQTVGAMRLPNNIGDILIAKGSSEDGAETLSREFMLLVEELDGFANMLVDSYDREGDNLENVIIKVSTDESIH